MQNKHQVTKSNKEPVVQRSHYSRIESNEVENELVKLMPNVTRTPNALTSSNVSLLQGTIGNGAVGRTLQQTGTVQRKFSTSQMGNSSSVGLIQRGLFDDVTGAVSNTAKSAAGWAENKVDHAASWAGNKAEGAADWAGEKANSAAGWVGDKAGSAATWAGEKANSAANWVGNKTEGVTDWAGEKANSAANWVGDKAEGAADWAGEKANSAANWVGDKAERSAGWAGEKADEGEVWAKEQIDSAREALDNVSEWVKQKA